MAKITNEIKMAFAQQWDLEITEKHFKAIERILINFEVTGDAPEVLNSPLLGVKKLFFTNQIKYAFFDAFNIDYRDFKRSVRKIAVINHTFKVTSDPYNLLSLWVVNRIFRKSKLSDKKKHQMAINVLKLLHYKFFTSKVNQLLPHGADADIMKLLVEKELGRNFSIIKHGTWKKSIEATCEEIISDKGLHRKTLVHHFQPDESVLYALSDIQTRLRNRLVRIVIEFYYPLKEKLDAESINSYELMGDINGDRVMRDTSGLMDTMVSDIVNKMFNHHQFIDMELIQLITKPNPNIRAELLKIFMIKFCDKAINDKRTGKLDAEKKIDLGMMPVGSRVLISKLLRETYRQCMYSGTKMTSKMDILQKTRNLYTSSRVLEPEVLMIKRSITEFIMSCGETRRDSTVSAARLCFIVYIIVLSFKYLK